MSRNDYEIKALGCYLFSETVSTHDTHDMIILCISTFVRVGSIHKDQMNMKNFIRLNSLKAITTGYRKEIADYIDDMLLKGARDKSVMVRRVATIGFYKVGRASPVEPEDGARRRPQGPVPRQPPQRHERLHRQQRSVSDRVQQNKRLGRSFLFASTLPQGLRQHLLLPRNRSSRDLQPSAQVRGQVPRLRQRLPSSKVGDPKDLELLRDTCDQLLYSNNPSLMIEVVKFLLRTDDKKRLKDSVRCCLRFLSSTSEIKYMFLVYVNFNNSDRHHLPEIPRVVREPVQGILRLFS